MIKTAVPDKTVSIVYGGLSLKVLTTVLRPLAVTSIALKTLVAMVVSTFSSKLEKYYYQNTYRDI